VINNFLIVFKLIPGNRIIKIPLKNYNANITEF
jgi:hypothetical protein